jgi:hypothetical protein
VARRRADDLTDTHMTQAREPHLGGARARPSSRPGVPAAAS